MVDLNIIYVNEHATYLRLIAKTLDRKVLESVPYYHTKYLLCVGKLTGSLRATKHQPHASSQGVRQTLKRHSTPSLFCLTSNFFAKNNEEVIDTLYSLRLTS